MNDLQTPQKASWQFPAHPPLPLPDIRMFSPPRTFVFLINPHIPSSLNRKQLKGGTAHFPLLRGHQGF